MTEVKSFWEEKAEQEDVSSERVTHKDIWQRWLEIRSISFYLNKKDRVLDVGCGNGYSTRIFNNLVNEIIGIDYSNAMITRARKETTEENPPARKKPTFLQCDVLDLSPSFAGYFDTVISERCLINLTNFDEQKRAIENIASVLKTGGLFIFVEGSAEGRLNLNTEREKFGLPKMPPVWHNVDFHEKETLKYLRKSFILKDRRSFGLYDFLSRIVHPLMVAPKEPKYDARINEIAAKLSQDIQVFQNLSRVLFLVLKKRTYKKKKIGVKVR